MPEGGAVVVRAEVQPRAPPGRGVDHPRHARGAVGEEDGLRRLHLHLEPQPALGQPVRRLEPPADVHHRLDLVDRGDLRQRHDPARRQVAGGQHLAEHEVEAAQPAPPRRTLQRLEPDPDERRAGPARHGRAERPPGGERVRVLLVVGRASRSRPRGRRGGPRPARSRAWPRPRPRPRGPPRRRGRRPGRGRRRAGRAGPAPRWPPRPRPRAGRARPARRTGRQGRRRCAPAAGRSGRPGRRPRAGRPTPPAARRRPPGRAR